MKICKNKNGFSYLLVCVITLFVAMLIVAGLS
ncbi:unknown [Anaerotruncus sp. CAG:390]|nr:unknown [Anaerotruncus sp. CAG:390]